MKTNLRSWASWLGQTRITLVLTLLVFFTFLHSCLCWLLEAQCHAKMTRITARSQTRQVPLALKDYGPKLTAPSLNAAPYYQAAYNLLDSRSINSFSDRFAKKVGDVSFLAVESEADRTEFETFVAAHREIFELVSRAHLKPECSYEIQYERGFQAQVPNFLKLRALAKLLNIRGTLARSKGDWDGWNQNMLEGTRFARRFDCDSSVIGLMIRVALMSQVLSSSHDVPVNRVSPELRAELRGFAAELPKWWDRAMQGEYLNAIDAFDRLENGKTNYSELVRNLGGSGDERLPIDFSSAAMSTIGRPLILMDKLSYLQYSEAANVSLNQVRKARSAVSFGLAGMLEINSERAAMQVNTSIDRLQKLSN